MEDTQPLTDPIIAPVRSKNFDLLEKKMPDTTFDFNFLAGLMDKPNLIRNICFLGAMHHGKTCVRARPGVSDGFYLGHF